MTDLTSSSNPSSPPNVDVKSAMQGQKQVTAWQKKLLPWLIAMPTVLIAAFMYLATGQVNQFNRAMENKEQSVIDQLHLTSKDSLQQQAWSQNLEYIKWITLVQMEEKSLQKRYHQGGLLLLSRIFIKYLGFLTGMILTIIGSIFIIGKLSEDTAQIEGSVQEHMKLRIVSSSPGIIFGVLGTILMVSTIWQHNEISVQDSPLYLHSNGIQALKDTIVVHPPTPKSEAERIDSIKAANIFK